MSAAILQTIASLEMQLNELKTSLGAEPTLYSTPKKAKKEKDPDAPKKEANVWIKFTVRVGDLLKAASEGASEEQKAHFKGPATMVKEFCSMLKQTKPYEAWEDSEILEAFETWERPAPKPRKSASAASSDAESTTASEKKERKKAAPKTDEEKAAINAKRAATIAAKKAAETKPEEPEVAAPEVAPVEEKPKTFKPKAKTYTLEQLQDFNERIIDGVNYGINARGDVADEDGKWVGRFDAAKNIIDKSGSEPADWSKCLGQ
jgi:hypothetical protein